MTTSADRIHENTDRAYLQAQIRSLENECAMLRETLRDKLAAAALQGLLASPHFDASICTHNTAARESFRLADAMLEARK